MRILCYAQHLSGVGHFVRMHTLARGLSRTHEVYLVDGGRPVPRSGDAGEITLLPLPALFAIRGASRRRLRPAHRLRTVLAARARALAAAVERIRPDVVLVDHYPFSKWELEDEIAGAIDTARRANPAVRVLCSLRDIAPRTRSGTCATGALRGACRRAPASALRWRPRPCGPGVQPVGGSFRARRGPSGPGSLHRLRSGGDDPGPAVAARRPVRRVELRRQRARPFSSCSPRSQPFGAAAHPDVPAREAVTVAERPLRCPS